MQSQLWDGLAYTPIAVWQSGGISRLFNIGELLRSKDEEIIRTRRALSQSVVYSYCSLPSDKPDYSPRQWAILESLKEILHRSELCPLDPAVDIDLLRLAGNPRWMCEEGEEYVFSGLSTEDALRTLRAWSRSRVPPATAPPIRVFDDEKPGGEGPERRFWNRLQSFRGGVLRAWLHPQILFTSLIEESSTEDRRIDFVLSAPWQRTLCLEIHGQFSQEDRVKSGELREAAEGKDKQRRSDSHLEGGWTCFDDILDVSHPDHVSDEERMAVLRQLLPAEQPSVLHDSSVLLDGAWIASQIDLALHFVLTQGPTLSDRASVRIEVPEGYETIRDASVSAFISLLRAVENVWGVAEGEEFFPDGVNAVAPPEEADLTLQIDPVASTYLPADYMLPHDSLLIRRACLPFDAAPGKLPWSVREIDGLRPESRPSSEALTVLLRRIFGKRDLRAGQAEGIARSLVGEDALILLPTGWGKSLVFQMAALLLPGVTLVVEGWRATIDDQLRCLEDLGIGRVLGIHYRRRLSSPRRLFEANLVYVAPERLYIDEFIEQLGLLVKARGIDLFVADEAHAVSEAGHSFRPSYLGIAQRMRLFCRRWGREPPTVLALTATAADVVLRDVRGILGIAGEPVTIRSGDESDAAQQYEFVRPNLSDEPVSYPAGQKQSGMHNALEHVLGSDGSQGKGIVFCSSRGRWTKSPLPWFGVAGTAGKIRQLLPEKTLVSEHIGGDLDDRGLEEREQMLREFLDGDARIMVSTNAFGTGIDIPDVTWTAHIGLPAGLEAYYQELGRAGRKGQPAFGFPVYDEDSNEFLEGLTNSQSTPDSFGPLRQLLAAGGIVKGSLARQLSLMLGAYGNLPGHGFGVETNLKFLPSFPGWRFEHATYNTCVVDSVFQSSDDEVEVRFARASDPFIWKAVHRLTELGIIRTDYRRTYKTRGLNTFTLTPCDLVNNATPEALAERIGVVVGRMRGGARGRQVRREALQLLSGIDQARDRVLAASEALIANTYEVVRECRVSSLVYLYSYMKEESQDERYALLEDYFGREEEFGNLILGLSDTEPTIEGWSRALDAALDESRWRTGVFQRAAEAFPGAPLPNFMLLYGAVLEEDDFGGGLALRRLAQVSGVGSQLLTWALERVADATSGGPRFVVELLDGAIGDMTDDELGRLEPWVLESAPNDLGDTRVAQFFVARWLTRALHGGGRHA